MSGRGAGRGRGLCLCLGLGLVASTPVAAQQSHLLVVSGLGGEPRYVDAFYEWGATMVDAARERYGLADSSVVFLAERPERDPARIRARSTKENVERAIEAIAGRAAPGDRVLILLIGHGSAAGGDPRLNLPGPDLTAAELAGLLSRLSEQRVAVVNTASASGAFLEALAGAGRVIVTSTRSGGQDNETIFGRYFVDAFAGDGADLDKDGRVSLLEAFEYARVEVARVYEGENLLQTEHALLDGDGDGTAVREPDAAGPDGRAAGAFTLTSAADPAAGVTDPALRALYERRAELERQVEALTAAKDTLDPERYQRELERLLLELAETSQAIRRAGGGT